MEYVYLFGLQKKKTIFAHKFLPSLVLLAMLIKCFKYKTNIPKENLIANNFIQKKISSTRDRVRKLILHKHLYRAENAWPDLGGSSGRLSGPSKC